MSYRPYQHIIAEAAAAASAGSKFTIQNDSGSTIAAFQPVAVDADGKVQAVDPSVDLDALKFLGIATESIPDGSFGNVLSGGKLEDVTTSYTFGDYIYVSKTGGLTNILPSEGVDGFVAGDWILRIGIIVRNKDTPSQKDLVVNLQIVGQI